MSNKTIEVTQDSGTLEHWQSIEWGLRLAFDRYPAARELTLEDDNVTIVSSDEESFAGCYVYEVSSDAVFVGLS